LDFYELGSYKEKIEKMFVTNPDIVDLTMPILDDSRFEIGDNFLGGEFQYKDTNSGAIENVTLIGHYFDVPFVYSSITDVRNLICIDTSISRADGETIKEITVSIEVICNKDNIKLSSADKLKYLNKYVGNRLDMIVEAIGLQLNSSRKFGLGRLKPSSRNPVRSYFPSEKYFGKILTYTCDDFLTDYAARSLNGS
jgi:hypothetical protein